LTEGFDYLFIGRRAFFNDTVRYLIRAVKYLKYFFKRAATVLFPVATPPVMPMTGSFALTPVIPRFDINFERHF